MDAESKVTLRPRSKLERLLESLSDVYKVPARPALDVLTQVVLLYLVGGGVEPRAAIAAIAPLCGKSGGVDPDKLAQTPRELVEAICAEPKVDETLEALRAAGEAGIGGASLDARCGTDLAEGRRLLRALPRITEQGADLLLLQAGIHAVVAPTGPGVHVAARLGYPGAGYGSYARALDAELPDLDGVPVAWRAHHLLDLHGRGLCARSQPQCERCPVHDGCQFHGEGEDPAAKLATLPPVPAGTPRTPDP
jgi:hypothetical protein